MGIGKIAFSGLRYLFGKGAKTAVKTAQKVAPKITQKVTPEINKAKQIEFFKQTSIYDPNNPFYIHRIF